MLHIQNVKGHQNCMIGSKGDFAEWVDFASWWSCIGKGLRLHPAQQDVSIQWLISRVTD